MKKRKRYYSKGRVVSMTLAQLGDQSTNPWWEPEEEAHAPSCTL